MKTKVNKFSLKSLQTLLDKTLAERQALNEEVIIKQSQQREINKKIQNLQFQINEAKRENIEPVTEHAILRYLERVKKIDIEAIKKEIIKHASLIVGGSGEIKKLINGSRFIIITKNKQVITIVKVKNSAK